jgi:hypothetical protein
MAMRFELKWVAAASAIMAAACAPVDPGFGEAVRYDQAIQTIDPDPVYDEAGAKPGDNGEKAAKATERYRKGTTKPVQRESASSSGSSGGGSGSN